MASIITPLTQQFASTRSDNVQPGSSPNPNIVSQPQGFPINQSLNPTDPDFTPVTEQEMNGTIYFYSDYLYKIGQGQQFTFDDALSASLPGTGYPKDIVLWCASNNSYQVSLIDNNTFNFVTNPSYVNDGIHWNSITNISLPDVVDDSVSGNVNIGGRIVGSYTQITTKVPSGIHHSVNTTVDNAALFTTENDGNTLNNGVLSHYGNRPYMGGNLATLGIHTESLAIVQDLPNLYGFPSGYSAYVLKKAGQPDIVCMTYLIQILEGTSNRIGATPLALFPNGIVYNVSVTFTASNGSIRLIQYYVAGVGGGQIGIQLILNMFADANSYATITITGS